MTRLNKPIILARSGVGTEINRPVAEVRQVYESELARLKSAVSDYVHLRQQQRGRVWGQAAERHDTTSVRVTSRGRRGGDVAGAGRKFERKARRHGFATSGA